MPCPESSNRERRSKPYSMVPNQTMVEVWHDGKFLATITGMEGPGVKIVSKHTIVAKPTPDDATGVLVMEVSITPASS